MEEDIPYKRITRMDIWEIVRRWHQKQSKSQIANSLGYDQKTIRKYIHAAKSLGIEQEKALPPKAEILSKLKAVASKRRYCQMLWIKKAYHFAKLCSIFQYLFVFRYSINKFFSSYYLRNQFITS
jgi:hypothetical protein